MAADTPAVTAVPTGISEETLQQLQESLLHPELIPLTAITRHPENARRGDVQSIRDSLREHGQYKALVVQRSTGYVLAGNHTLQGITDEGWEHAVVVYLDVDDDEARRILLVDNRTSDLATYDDKALLDVLKALDQDQGLAGTGYTEDDYQELRRLTGELGHDQSSFLDDLRDTNNSQTAAGRNHYQLIFPCSKETRDIVNEALSRIQADRGLETSVEALQWLAGSYKTPRPRAAAKGDTAGESKP